MLKKCKLWVTYPVNNEKLNLIQEKSSMMVDVFIIKVRISKKRNELTIKYRGTLV